MRVFKTKWLARFARGEKLDDASLAAAIGEIERGLVDADLGGGLIKKRVARAGAGKRGGYRMVIAYRSEERAVFLYGFAKSERDNIGPDELATLQDLAAGFLKADAAGMEKALRDGTLTEVAYGEGDEEEGR